MRTEELRNLAWSIEGISADESAVLAAESEIGSPIPEPLRAFIRLFDSFAFEGREGVQRSPFLLVDDREYNLSVFFGVVGQKYNLVKDRSLQDSYTPMKIVPFAKDSFGNRYVWSTVSAQISFIDYDRYGGARGLEKIADSMSDFFEMIVE